jgi:hypothetical protein
LKHWRNIKPSSRANARHTPAQVAAKAKELEAREDNIVRREDALKTAEARTANLENDLHRRLKILKNAAA